MHEFEGTTNKVTFRFNSQTKALPDIGIVQDGLPVSLGACPGLMFDHNFNFNPGRSTVSFTAIIISDHIIELSNIITHGSDPKTKRSESIRQR